MAKKTKIEQICKTKICRGKMRDHYYIRDELYCHHCGEVAKREEQKVEL